MTHYDFTLRFRLGQADESAEEHIDNLSRNGCDDAIIGVGKPGRVSLNFTREADNAFTAITSAITDVRNAIPDAVLVEATPDLVGITDIARIYSASRQYMRKIVLNQNALFPEPVHEGNPSLWHLAEVLDWIMKHEPDKLDKPLSEVSDLNMQINLYKSLLMRRPSYFFADRAPDETTEWDRFFRPVFGYARAAEPKITRMGN